MSESTRRQRKSHFQELLDSARATAAITRNYSFHETRQRLTKAFKSTFGADSSPYDWQLDITEALLLGLDTIVIAGTGAGKTMPFSMPFLLEENTNKIVIIISPLDQLEDDQVSGVFLNA
ncbi:hypothetical protein WOLCODRAFT_78711 [Wolfiporia cocos MD-104 SS10]|uniref:DEAD/DEAH-box helicase domain-containing protein n=1 Tax=Wolfiporia cocos (strain MD-104) TaxID=742152 RepID=A0A2H3J7B2_WOLCO|nr:hypothetical protein WOLCODRAFT_78711 [Wolfiporia cocos MD-104 SS10]